MKENFKIDFVNYEKEILIFNNSCCFETSGYVENAEELCKEYFELKNNKNKEKIFFYILKNEKELKEKFISNALDQNSIDYIKEIDFRIFSIDKNNCFYEIFPYFEDCIDLFEYSPDLFKPKETILRIKKINGKILFIKRKAKYLD